MPCGRVSTRSYPRAAHTKASAIPVLPLVASTIVVRPGSMIPSASAASIIATPIRSLTDPPGLNISSLANSWAPSGAMRVSCTIGVAPTWSAMLIGIPGIGAISVAAATSLPCAVGHVRLLPDVRGAPVPGGGNDRGPRERGHVRDAARPAARGVLRSAAAPLPAGGLPVGRLHALRPRGVLPAAVPPGRGPHPRAHVGGLLAIPGRRPLRRGGRHGGRRVLRAAAAVDPRPPARDARA